MSCSERKKNNYMVKNSRWALSSVPRTVQPPSKSIANYQQKSLSKWKMTFSFIFNFNIINRTSVEPRRHLVLVGILAKLCDIYICLTHRQNIYSSVQTEYLSFIWVIHLLAVGHSWTELHIFYMSVTEFAD